MTLDEKINEYYEQVFKIYGSDELTEMCKNCERWNGKEHDYTECKHRPCFRFFCAYGYLRMLSAWDNSSPFEW